MKKTLVIILSFSIYATISLGQQLKSDRQFIFSGKISEYAGTSIVISFEDENFKLKQYKIPTQNGSFRFISTDFKKPKVVSLDGENFSGKLLVGPGYNIKITSSGERRIVVFKKLENGRQWKHRK